MVKQIGEHAIVIGAGVGGLLFARGLAGYFEDVTVVERDSLADNHEPRNGVPQGRHPHGLLAGGCRAMDALLPGLVEDFKAVGAVKQVAGLSTRFEMPGYDPFPQRDLGFCSYGLSRPLLELCMRRRVQAIANVSWEQNTAVERVQHYAGAVTGVVLRDGRSLPADLVIDASGSGELTLRAFDEMRYARPRETTIGIDLHYATALFAIPDDAADDWNVLITYPKPPLATSPNRPQNSFKAALVSTIEGNRWICTVAWQGEEQAPIDRESFIELTRTVRTQTCYHAIKDATMLGKVVGFVFRSEEHTSE